MAYDKNNIFAKIIRGEIPCPKALENEHAIAFNDINPLTPKHILVIPKGEYTSMNEFAEKASDAEIAAVIRAIGQVAKDAGISEDGYRVITNIGDNGGQEVKHLHFHVLGGKKVGPMTSRS